MMKYIYIISILTMMSFIQTNDVEIIRFYNTDLDTIIIYKNDILSIDLKNKTIKLTPKGQLKIVQLNLDSLKVSYFNENNLQEEIKIIDARYSERLPPYNYILKNNENIFFYSKFEIVYEGIFIEEIIEKYKIPYTK